MRRACPRMIFLLCTTLPHNLIKEKKTGFDRVDIQKGIKKYGSLYLACNDRKGFFFTSSNQSRYIHFGHVRMCATPYPISWIIFILDLGQSYTDKLLEL